MTVSARVWTLVAGLLRSVPPRVVLLLAVLLVTSVLSRWGERDAWVVEGLPKPRKPVTVALLDPAAFSERLHHAQAADSEDLRCRRLGMQELGLVSSAEPSGSLLPTSLWENMRGAEASPAFYVTGTDTIFTATEHNPTIQHEMVHAVEDQYSTRMEKAKGAGTTDSQIALRAAIEGTAIVISEGKSPPLRFGRDLDYNAQVLAYVRGPAYLKKASGGSSFDGLVAVHPSSSYEVLFGVPAQTRVLPPSPQLMEDERILCTDEIGAMGLIAALASGNVPPAKGMLATRGWVADRLDVVAGSHGRRVLWSVVFSDPEAASIWRTGPAFQIPLTAPRVHIDTHTTGMAKPGAASPQSVPSPFESLGR